MKDKVFECGTAVPRTMHKLTAGAAMSIQTAGFYCPSLSPSVAVNGNLFCQVVRRGPISRPALSTPTITNQSNSQVQKEHNPGNDAIRNLALRGVVRKFHSQPTVNDSKHDETSAKPDMSMTPEVTVLLTHINIVVNQAQKRLEEEKPDDDDADDWVGISELVDGPYINPYSFPFPVAAEH